MTATHWRCAVCGKLATAATANLHNGKRVVHRGCRGDWRDSRGAITWNTPRRPEEVIRDMRDGTP